jgi:hypothetical protein
VWPDDETGINAQSGWQISHWWGLWGPNRMDKWATDHQDQGNPVSVREWAALLRALQQLGWSALDQCRSVWKVFCQLRAGIDADVAAKAKTVASRARQQRGVTRRPKGNLRAAKREKAAADKEQAHRLRGSLEASRPDRPPGWTAHIPDRAVLHWGAMRNFITLLGGNSLRIAALANVTATARLILS